MRDFATVATYPHRNESFLRNGVNILISACWHLAEVFLLWPSLMASRWKMRFGETKKVDIFLSHFPVLTCSISALSSIESVKDNTACHGLLWMSSFHVFINLIGIRGQSSWQQHWYFKVNKACGITGNIYVLQPLFPLHVFLSCFNLRTPAA